MKISRKKHTTLLLLLSVALIITGIQASCSIEDPSETVDNGSTMTSHTMTAPTSSTTTPSSETTIPSPKPSEKLPKLDGAVALTFDDGPGAHTGRLLDALKEYDAKATFFVVGRVACENEENMALIKRMVDEGHEVANHSYSHFDFLKISDSAVLKQISKTNETIVSITGKIPTLLRPPYGNFDNRVTQLAKQEGLAIVLWTPSPEDWRYKDVDYVCNFMLDYIEAGNTFLLHDVHKTTVDGVIKALPMLAERGLKLVTVSELFDLKPGDIHPASWGGGGE